MSDYNQLDPMPEKFYSKGLKGIFEELSNAFKTHEDSKEVNEINSAYRKKLAIGVIGATGNLGRSIVNRLLAKSENINLNLYSRNYDTLSLGLPEIAGIVERDGELISFKELEDKMKAVKKIDSDEFFDSDIIIFAARNNSVPFSSFKSRDDEYIVNRSLVKDKSELLQGYKGIIINLTNSLELVCEDIAKYSKIPRNKIVGVSYTDTIRFKRALVQTIKETNLLQKSFFSSDHKFHDLNESDFLEAIVIGEHGPNMVPIYSSIKIGDKPFSEIDIDSRNLRKRVEEILKNLPNIIQTGKSSLKNIRDPTIATIETLESLINGVYKPMSTFDGDCFISLPATCLNSEKCIKINRNFLGKISETERKKFRFSKHNILTKLNKFK